MARTEDEIYTTKAYFLVNFIVESKTVRQLTHAAHRVH